MTLLSGWPSLANDSGACADGTVLTLTTFNDIKASIEDQVHSAVNTTTKPKDTTDEVVTARGTLGTLDTRLDVALNNDGTLKTGAADTDFRSRGVGQENLALNGEFEDWPSGSTSAPEHWTLSNATIVRAGPGEADTNTFGTGRFTVKLTWTGPGAVLTQSLVPAAFFARYVNLKGRKVAVVVRAKTSIASHASIVVDDGVTTTRGGLTGNGTYHSGGGAEELLYAVHTMSGSATKLDIRLEVASAGSAYYGGVGVVLSDVAPANSLLFRDRPETRKLFTKTTQTDVVGAAETSLATFTLVRDTINSLTETAEELEINAFGTTAGNANAKTWRFKFGGTTFFTFTRNANAEHWWLKVRIIRTADATQKIIANIVMGAANNGDTTYTAGTIAFTSDQTIDITGQATSNADIRLEGATVERV